MSKKIILGENFFDQFFVELQKWIEAGTPDTNLFREGHAICANAERFLDTYLRRNREMNNQPYRMMLNSICGELQDVFVKFGLPKDYPFNGNERDFLTEDMEGKHWTNQKRLSFVKRYVQQLKTHNKEME